MGNRLIRFNQLPLKSKVLYFEAFLLLGLSRLIVSLLSFKTLAGLLGVENLETDFSNDGIDLNQVKQIAKAISTMSKYTPWNSKCLVQAYAAKQMLKRRGLPYTIYLGIAKDENKRLIAHAWVRCGTYYVTGGDGSKKFTITGCFSS